MPTVGTGDDGAWWRDIPSPTTARPTERALVGRVREFDLIRKAVIALDGDWRVPVLALVGEPGIGKSRLLGETAALAEAHGRLVLRGRAAEFEQDLPFAAFVDALEHHVVSVDRGWLETLSADGVSEVRHAFPALSPVAQTASPALVAERYRADRAMRALLEDLATPRPLVLILDDVQWADEASLELLCHLVRHPPVAPVLIALAFRQASAPPRLLAELGVAVRDGQCRLLELGPLTASESGLLAGERVARAYLPALYAESGGNPFFIEQLVRTGQFTGGGSTEPARDATMGVPPAVAGALRAELGSLPPAAQTFARAAAVVGDPFDQDLAAAAAGMDDPQALEALDVLANRGIVNATAQPRRFRFQHPIVRRAVYESAAPGWRLAAHGRIAAALAAEGVVASMRAHHVEMSAHRGDEAAISVLVEAAESVASRAPASAAQWYEAALRLLPATVDAEPRRLRFLATAAMARASAGHLDTAHTHLSRALVGVPRGTDLWLMLVSMCAEIEGLLGRFNEGRMRLLDALGAFADPDGPEAAAIKLALSIGAVYASDVPEAERWAAEVVRSRAHVPPALITVATSLLALALCVSGDTVGAAERVDEAAAAFDSLDDDALAGRIDSAHWLALVEVNMERFGDAARHCERGMAVSRKAGRGDWIVGIMHLHVWSEAAVGRLAAASEAALATVDAARVAGYPVGLSVALWEQSTTACLTGDLVTALRAGEEAVEVCRTLAPGVITALPGVALGRACLESGQPDRARDQILASGGGPELPLLFRTQRMMAYDILSAAELAVGAVTLADGWVVRAEAELHEHSLPLEAATVWRARAAVLLASGKAEEAAQMARRAAAAAAAAPVEEAKCRLLAGRALARAGSRKEAVAELERAEAQFGAHGANRYRDEAAAELRRLGRRAQRNCSYATGLESLTEREQEIAQLVSKGMRNRQIAARCFISEKTVEAILSSTFAKLGVANRAGLTGVIVSSRRPEVGQE